MLHNKYALRYTVILNCSTYEVIGTFDHHQGLFLRPGVDLFAIIPLSKFHKEYPEAKELFLICTVPKDVNVETAQGEVIQALRRLRRGPGGKENDFELSDPDFVSKLCNRITLGRVVVTTGTIT